MKKVLFLVMAMFVSAPVFAQDAEPKSNQTWETTKKIVDALDPAIEYGMFMKTYKVDQLEGFTGLSGALYTFKSQDLSLGSVRIGVMLQDRAAVYATAQANGINLARRYAPDTVKEFFSPGPMGDVWSFIGDYGKIGIGPAYDADANKFGAVATIGARISW